MYLIDAIDTMMPLFQSFIIADNDASLREYAFARFSNVLPFPPQVYLSYYSHFYSQNNFIFKSSDYRASRY